MQELDGNGCCLEDEFNGDISVTSPLTAFLEKPSLKRGRPKGLDDGQLWGARAALLDVLENYWGRVGWELRRAKTIADVRAALQPLADYHRDRIDLYVRASTSRATPQNARTTQWQLWELASRSRVCYSRKQQLWERLERAKGALNMVRGTAQEAEIEALCIQRHQALEEVEKEYQQLDEEDRKLVDNLRNQHAYIAQTELLRFLRSGRYSLTPLNVANAMAGLPYMGWRQSSKRCASIERPRAQGFSYQLFLIVNRATKKSTPRQLLSTLEQYLRKRPKTDYTSEEVKKNWYYLKSAVQSVIQTKPHPRAIPYRVVAEYQRRISSRSQVDLVLEEEEQLQ